MPRGAGGDVDPAEVDQAHEREVRNARWVAARRRGESIGAIAELSGVHHTTVERVTRPFGPFPKTPDDEDLERRRRWALMRQAGFAVAVIAAAEGVTVDRVLRATQDAGPFGRPRATARVVGLMSLPDLSVLTKMPNAAVYGWWHRGLLPTPTESTHLDQPLWERSVLEAWADERLTTCPECGARALDLGRHRGSAHR